MIFSVSCFKLELIFIHPRSIDDVDKSILEAKTALMDLTQDLSERSQRWRQIEMLTGVGIVNNPGIQTLQRLGQFKSDFTFPFNSIPILVRHVGGGNRGIRGGDRLSSRMSSVSVDDLRDDFETRSVAASHTSHLSGSRLGAGAAYQSTRRQTKQLSRDSSKESSEESDETGFSSGGGLKMVTGRTGHRTKQLVKQQSRHSEMSASSGVSGVSDFSAVAPSAVSSVSVSPPEDRR